MKMQGDDRAAEERMAPGIITSAGFLGHDPRPLVDIIQGDEEHFRALDLDFDEVADALERLAQRGGEGLGEPITVDATWLVRSDDARGKLPCPWGDGIFHKTSVSLQRGSYHLSYSELSIHLLRVHHFCQGIGSPFRLEPVTLKMMLKS